VLRSKHNKSSAVAEMGDRLATIEIDQKLRWGMCPFWGELAFHRTQCGLGRGLPPYQVASGSIQSFGHYRNRPKLGEYAPFLGRGLGPHLAQCGLDHRANCHLDPSSRLATIYMGSAPFLGRGAESPSNTMSLRPRPTSLPSGILIYPAIWLQQIWAKNWVGLCPFGEGSGIPI